MSEQTELWWLELRLWPVVIRIEAEVYIETRGLPGMASYHCAWNELVAWFWRLKSVGPVEALMRAVKGKPVGGADDPRVENGHERPS